MSYFLGVDPGLHGAIAVYHTKRADFALVRDMPLNHDGVVDAAAVARLISDIDAGYPILRAAVENVGSRPRQQGAFSFGLYTGIVHGCLASAAIPFDLVSPQVWKQAMGLTRRHDETVSQNKTRARALATQLFPHLAAEFRRVKDDGRAEALLLTVYHANLKR